MAGDRAARVLSLFSMRATTFTVDSELADRIERLSREKAVSFENVANEALREGLALLAGGSAPKAEPTSYTRPVSLGGCLLEHDLLLCSGDGGYSRFAELKWRNPLLEPS